MSELDKDFESFLPQINAKLAEAAAAMKEVNRLRQEAGLESLIFTSWMRQEAWRNLNRQMDEMTEEEAEQFDIDAKMDEISDQFAAIDVGPLESELSHAGWSTSSSYC